jgi:hypothetical protein
MAARARAQQSDQVRRIGVLMGYPESDLDARAWYAAFREVLQRLGWTEGRNCPPSALMRQIGWVEEGRISGSS